MTPRGRGFSVMPPDPPKRWPWQLTDREFLAHMVRTHPLFTLEEMVAELVECGGPDLAYLLPSIDLWE
jgi:hypothetical protein